MRHDDAARRFAEWREAPDETVDLTEGALLIAAQGDPALDEEVVRRRLDTLAAGAGEALAGAGTPEARAEALNRFLFESEGFAGNAADYYDPRNSFLHEVLARRTGIPITLAVVYLAVGRRLGLALAGVSFPGHFLVRLSEPAGEVIIDPFAGRVLDEDDCTALLQAVMPGAALSPALLRPAPRKLILRRMLTNLKLIALRQGDPAGALGWIGLILALAGEDAAELRDRGLVHLQLECYPEARADLERYLALAPGDPEAEAVRPHLETARRRAGRLN